MAVSGNTQHTGSQRDVKDKERNRRDRLAAYLYDVSKLLIGTTFLSNILPLSHGQYTLTDLLVFVFGAVAAIIFAYMGNKLLTY